MDSTVTFRVGAILTYMGRHSPKAGMGESGNSVGQSLDDVFDLLSNQRRRYVLSCLADTTQPLVLTSLAEDVAICENESPRTEISKEEVRTVRTSLYNSHIPKLVDAGVVKYNQERGLIRGVDSADMVERVLCLTADGQENR